MVKEGHKVPSAYPNFVDLNNATFLNIKKNFTSKCPQNETDQVPMVE